MCKLCWIPFLKHFEDLGRVSRVAVKVDLPEIGNVGGIERSCVEHSGVCDEGFELAREGLTCEPEDEEAAVASA